MMITLLNYPKAVARRTWPAALLTGLLLSACTSIDIPDAGPAVLDPETIAFTQANLYPEGVQYDAANARFFVSSQTTGRVGQVDDTGMYNTYVDNAQLVSTIGLKLDETRGRLLAAVSDPGYNTQRTSAATLRKLAKLAIFNRDKPQLSPQFIDLGALRPALNHFANDIAVDALGNAYVTDSFAPIIYKVDTQGNATVFLENAQLSAPAGAFGLNGIVFHPDGYLLVAKSDEGAIIKVPIANPTSFTKLTTSQNLMGADGIRLQDNNTLQVACNSQAKVYRLSSADGWGSAVLYGTFTTPPQYPTTLTARGNTDGYVLYSNLNALQASQTPPVSVFTIAQLRFL
jgi:sugar lactone lactonase YvrE